MTKIFDIVHISPYMYVVDGEAKCPKDSIAIFPNTTNGKINSYNPPIVCKWDYGANGVYNIRVIASNNPNINLPLLPAIEEDVVKLSYKATENKTFAGGVHEKAVAEIYFRKGYKAASPKKYTEEDLLTYMDNGMEIWKKLIKDEFDSGRYKERENPFEWTEKEVHRLAVLSLNPLPIQVELIMTNISGTERGPWGEKPDEPVYQPDKIYNAETKQFTVQVKRWIWT